MQPKFRSLSSALAALDVATYDDYMASPHWASVKRRYRQDKSRPQRCICGAPWVVLHHRTYERLGAERLDDLYPLCGSCHQMIHLYIRVGLVEPDASPEILKSPERARELASSVAATRARAAEETAAPRPLKPFDTTTVAMLKDRASKHPRGRTFKAMRKDGRLPKQRRRRRKGYPRNAPPPQLHAQPEDLALRSFTP